GGGGGAAGGAPAATAAATLPAAGGASGLSEHFGGMDVPSYQALTRVVSGLRSTVLEKGTAALYSDTSLLAQTLKALEEKFDDDYKYTAAAGMKYVRSEPGPFVWNLVEPEKGKGYRWEFPDLHVKMARKYGLDPIVTVRHYSAWDTSKCGSKASGETAKVVQEGSFWYFGGYFGPVCDLDDFSRWMEAMAERYDGDGKDDMPGLGGQPVKLWEIFNEVQGPDGGYAGKGAEFAKVQKLAAEIIKKHCSGCIVSNDGAFDLGASPPGAQSSRDWFKDAFKAGLGSTIDALNWHWNIERNGIEAESKYRSSLDDFNSLMKTAGVSKPMWITEIGTFTGKAQSGGGVFYGGDSGGSTVKAAAACEVPAPARVVYFQAAGGKCGDGTCDSIEKQTGGCPVDCGGSLGSPMPTPSGSPPSGSPPSGSPPSGSPPSGSPPSSPSSSQSSGSTQSEEQQAAWYVQRYATGFANGATLFTPDVMGVSSDKGAGGVGTGSLVYRDSPGSQVGARLLFYVHKILAAKIGQFTAAEELDKGQVKFTVAGRPVYILWDPSQVTTSSGTSGPGQTGSTTTGGKCGDGTCDSIEKQTGGCPVDCGGTTAKAAASCETAGSTKRSLSLQGGKCGDGTCDSIEKQTGGCPVDCGGSSGSSPPGGSAPSGGSPMPSPSGSPASGGAPSGGGSMPAPGGQPGSSPPSPSGTPAATSSPSGTTGTTSAAKLSSQITGRLKVTDLYGSEKTLDASQLTLSGTPVFAEPA
ncbi:MAG: hypothetical protein QXO51_08445, partial [Halobacteria archaeon]